MLWGTGARAGLDWGWGRVKGAMTANPRRVQETLGSSKEPNITSLLLREWGLREETHCPPRGDLNPWAGAWGGGWGRSSDMPGS